uniref:L-2-hydroxyglutarate dehydrogenase, mitochondrial n=1 Tax=Rhizochromulina marina TaxID=1034831 RepID=A0A7S2SSJ6_9STRA|mmetsp:Transcript_6368/g.18640  ORF Transcript_6368/g.18640 Transcript_6368/m.18640 type:complete len:379 (+) Transcript_6368:250-1386(+)
MDKIQAVVVGAGVVGLAVARELARRGREVMVLEKEALIGAVTSSRNSEVVHSGIYYPKGSLKAACCVEGRELLYEFCADHGVAAERVGKLIVATHQDQLPTLHRLMASGRRNGVSDLRLLGAAEVEAMEPSVRAVAALHSPSTGIVDSHSFMLALQADAEAAGAAVVLRTPVTGAAGASMTKGWERGRVVLKADGMQLDADLVVNATGLQASAFARDLGLPAAAVPDTFFAKGNYFRLEGVRCPFSHLIYPVPEAGGLGVHATLDLAGQVRFGPDVEWVDDPQDYVVDPARGDTFYAEVRKYWPALPDGALAADYSGIRPKLHPAYAATQYEDFRVVTPETGSPAPNLVSLFGIESPGLTSALALARVVVDACDREGI